MNERNNEKYVEEREGGSSGREREGETKLRKKKLIITVWEIEREASDLTDKKMERDANKEETKKEKKKYGAYITLYDIGGLTQSFPTGSLPSLIGARSYEKWWLKLTLLRFVQWILGGALSNENRIDVLSSYTGQGCMCFPSQ